MPFVLFFAIANENYTLREVKLDTKKGKVTVAKKTKKGTYTIKVTVTVKGTTEYKAGSKTVTVTVKVN